MANWNDPQPRTGFGASPSLGGRVQAQAGYDAGLRRHMLSIYNYMASGVLLSGVVAMLFAQSGFAAQVLTTPLRWLIMLAPLGFELVRQSELGVGEAAEPFRTFVENALAKARNASPGPRAAPGRPRHDLAPSTTPSRWVCRRRFPAPDKTAPPACRPWPGH